MKNWKNLFPLFALILSAIFPASAQTSKPSTQKWDSTTVAQTIAHIFAKGKQTGPDEMKFVLPTSGHLLLQGAPGDAILTLSSDTFNFSIFLSEAKSFKGNLFEDKYASRYSVADQKKFNARATKFLQNFVKTKPVPAVALIDGKDPLTLQYLAWVKKLKTLSKKSEENVYGAKFEFDSEWETDKANYNLSVSYQLLVLTNQVYLSFHKSAFNKETYDEIPGKDFFIILDLDRPILQGTLRTDEEEKPLSADVLKQIFEDTDFK